MISGWGETTTKGKSLGDVSIELMWQGGRVLMELDKRCHGEGVETANCEKGILSKLSGQHCKYGRGVRGKRRMRKYY